MVVLGNIDSYDPLTRRVQGWCALKSDNYVGTAIEVCVDENLVLEVESKKYREDLLNANIGNGFYAFDFKLPALAPSTVVEFREKTTSMTIPNGKLSTLGEFDLINLSIESISDTQIIGWVYNSARMSPLKVEFISFDTVTRQTKIIASGLANNYKAEIEAGRYCGFELAVSWDLVSDFSNVYIEIDGVRNNNIDLTYFFHKNLLNIHCKSMLSELEKDLEVVKKRMFINRGDLISDKEAILNSSNDGSFDRLSLLERQVLRMQEILAEDVK